MQKKWLRKTNSILLLYFLAWYSLPATADIFTAGPDGTFSTVQAALDSAAATSGDHEVRVQSGTYFENIALLGFTSADSITISGGWNSSFTERTALRSSVLDGSSAGRVLNFELSANEAFQMQGFIIENSLVDRRGAVSIRLDQNSQAFIVDNTIQDNVTESERTEGGGLWASINGTSHLSIIGNDIMNNTVNSTGTVDVRGGGLDISISDQASFEMSDNIIEGNTLNIAGSGSGLGAGANINIFDGNASITINDNRIANNQINAETALGLGMLIGGSGWTLRRNEFIGNSDGGVTTFGAQLSASVFNGLGQLSDTLIVDGNARGLQLNSNNGGELNATNLTVVNHAERGILANTNGTGELNLFNSISINADTNAQLGAGVIESNNLFTDNPALLVNPAGGNFELADGSPAIDAGQNNPPGGLGPTDLNGVARIIGPNVDIGAYERSDVIFVDSFES